MYLKGEKGRNRARESGEARGIYSVCNFTLKAKGYRFCLFMNRKDTQESRSMHKATQKILKHFLKRTFSDDISNSFKTREEYENSFPAPAGPATAVTVERSASFERISKLRSLFSRQTATGGGKTAEEGKATGEGKTTRSWRRQLTSSSSHSDLTAKSEG